MTNGLRDGTTLNASKVNNMNLVMPQFNFAAAGDWGCNEITQQTANSMQNKDPELVLALGDFSYQADTGC